MSDFTIVQPDGPLYRLARVPDPWAWPDWAYAGLDGTFGNRWDDPLGSYRVLYASSRRLGAFIVYEWHEEHGDCAGICYRSRLGDQFINWAIFEPPPDASIELPGTDLHEIEPDDPDLLKALDLLDLELV